MSGTADGLYIDRPDQAAPGEPWTMNLARPVADEHGGLRAIVIVRMKVPHLEQFYGWQQLDYMRPISLYLADGTLVASEPHREGDIGHRAPELGSDPLPGVGSQVGMVTRPVGNTTRSYAFARAGAFPLLVGVRNDDTAALASWRDQALSISLGAMLVCAFTIVAAIALARELEREARLTTALRDANERYHRTIDSLKDAVVSVDELHNVTLFNPAAERMFGVPAGKALGGPIARFVPERAREAYAYNLACFMQSPDAPNSMEGNRDVTGLRADGTEFPIEFTFAHSKADGQPEVTSVMRDVTERRRAERELRESNRQLRALSSSLQDVREQERTRIAAELHDELGQQLTGLKLELSWAATRIKEGRMPTIEQVDAMRHQLDGTIATVRRIATELRPRVLDDVGFGEAVAWQASEFARRSGIAVDVDFAAAACVTDDAIATALFRIVQESLTNVARHSGAARVRLRLRLDPTDSALLLTVHDDGRGMSARKGQGGGIGLLSMRERALALGGTLRVVSQPERGTRIEVTVPLVAAALQEAQEMAA
jgi:PAS domain S-box-containing protein